MFKFNNIQTQVGYYLQEKHSTKELKHSSVHQISLSKKSVGLS
jgi:hypothetical protein